jgi:hypothetical protein
MAKRSDDNDSLFVIVQNRPGARLGGKDFDRSGEGGAVAQMLSGKLFRKEEWIRLTELQIRARPTYRSRGGSDYAPLEAAKRWATFKNKGIVIKVK